MLILGHELRRDLFTDDPTKQTVVSHQVSKACSVDTADNARTLRTTAIAATAAVSNRNTFAPSDTGWKLESMRLRCSDDSRPPSGPTAIVTGSMTRVLKMGSPRASSTSRDPRAGSALKATSGDASACNEGSHGAWDWSNAARIRAPTRTP